LADMTISLRSAVSIPSRAVENWIRQPLYGVQGGLQIVSALACKIAFHARMSFPP
jgi:hypothetical protein